jgi:hypothetical protein
MRRRWSRKEIGNLGGVVGTGLGDKVGEALGSSIVVPGRIRMLAQLTK